MKNSIKLLIAFIGIISFSCSDDVQDTGVVEPDSSLKLINPTSSFNLVLDGAKLNNIATTFVWNDPSNSGGTATNYSIEAALAGTNFATPVVIGTTTNQFLDVTVGTLDTKAKIIGLQPLHEGEMEVRIKTSSQTSNSFILKVTPYQPNWGIIGSATPLGWDNSTAMTYNPTNGIYSISLALNAGEFKFRLDNSWTTNYGDSNNDFILDTNNNNNIPIATAGNYTIVFNLATNSYSITPIVNAWGIIGDATPTDWSADTLLDFNSTTNKYSIVMKMKVGSFKFRLNHDWGTNYGDSNNDFVLDTNNNNNIPITTSGDYIINVDFAAQTYTIVKL